MSLTASVQEYQNCRINQAYMAIGGLNTCKIIDFEHLRSFRFDVRMPLYAESRRQHDANTSDFRNLGRDFYPASRAPGIYFGTALADGESPDQ